LVCSRYCARANAHGQPNRSPSQQYASANQYVGADIHCNTYTYTYTDIHVHVDIDIDANIYVHKYANTHRDADAYTDRNVDYHLILL
jgi:hypothetical protein